MPIPKGSPFLILLAILVSPMAGPMLARGVSAAPDDSAPAYPTITTIRIERTDVFDLENPDERHAPYVLANKLHIETREHVIRRELLFREGDPADPDVLYESERNLRRLNFLHDNSRILTVARDDGRVDVVVRTRDIWTTRPSVSVSRAGNETTGRFSFIEDNLAGFGKRLGASYKRDLDRDSGGLEYSDPRLFGTRWTLGASYFDRSDGLLYKADAGWPFYSVWTPQAGGGGGSHFSQVTTLQIDGEDAPGFRQRHSDVTLHYGWAPRRGYEKVRRLVYRFRLMDDEFDPEPGEAPLVPLPPVGGAGYAALPEDRRFRILEAEYQCGDVRFQRASHLDRFDRFQDVNLGNDWSVSLGLSPVVLGDSHNHLFFGGRFSRWLHMSPNTYSRLEAGASGRLSAGIGRSVITEIDLRHYFLGLPRQTLVFHAAQAWGHNLDGDRQFLLGGESGLRGYDNRRFDGNKRLLLNVEDRVYIVYDWLHLVSIAFAGFADAGFAWRAGEGQDLGDVVGNIGAGFRFDVTRSSGGTVMRLDYAYPVSRLGREENPRGVLSFTAGQAF
ncbi:MAG: BamA/TamA family outer membrane protein [Acidobacteria bacterium]|nr:BamA/TamA family outer membrane protein [Acidobacteriota bacterium]